MYSFRSNYYQYSVASTNQAVFFIGGRHLAGGSFSSVIAKYEDDEWSPRPYGNLKKSRRALGSIAYGTEMVVIGGETNDNS